MSHLNAFCLIKDKYNLSFKKRKKSLKHLSKKKCEKNQSILPFYKKKKSLFIIYSDEDNSKNDEFNSNSSSFTTSLSNQSKLLKNSDLFKIYESEDSKSIFNSIKKTNFEKEIGPNKSPEQKCFENIDILHESEFHKNNSKNLANTNNFFHKNKKENSNNKSDLIVDTENIIDNNLYPIVDTENIIDNNLYPIVDTEDIIDNNLYPIVDTEDIIDNSSETLAFSENQSLNENTRKNNTNHYSPSNISTNSSDSESFSTIARIKKRKFISSASNSDNESQLEIENELKDLNKKDIIKERTRGSKWNIKKTMFQRQLQKLKKKKNKTLEDSSDELEIINTSQSISNYDSNSSFSDNEINKNDYESTALDNFIVDDDELIGEPYIDVPVEFTIFSYQGISSHFKIFLQYKIHKLLNPEIKESEQFVFSLKYLERKFNSLRDSVLSSSVWKLPFIDALSSRPILKTGTCEPRFLCDACNISKRISTFWIQFHGPKYNPKTLEIYENKKQKFSEKINDSDEKIWYLGKFCYLRAKTTHRFWHWHFDINEELKKILKKLGKFDESFRQILLNMNISERIEKIDKIIIELDNSGKINEIWENFNRILEQAENFMLEPNRFKKEEY